MLLEHIVYSAAFALMAGMVYRHFTGRDPSWIIIACAWAPDIDEFLYPVARRLLGISLTVNSHPLRHGDLHTFGALIVFAVLCALFLRLSPFNVRLRDGLLFGGLGYGVHLACDALVYNPAYAIFWPLSSMNPGLGLFHYSRDLFGLADSQVLAAGILLLVCAIIIRTAITGTDWIEASIPWHRPPPGND
ncbi:MAG: metal-dependent hydrolase [Methanomicrobiaceae archaeon]|nr:metal-dependent hydrolase [Methanomicrobiaceae archaeon]